MNARREFLKFCERKEKVKCAYIATEERFWKNPEKIIILKVNYTPEEYNQFLDQLDFEYDAGYGGQYLFGNIWFSNQKRGVSANISRRRRWPVITGGLSWQ